MESRVKNLLTGHRRQYITFAYIVELKSEKSFMIFYPYAFNILLGLVHLNINKKYVSPIRVQKKKFCFGLSIVQCPMSNCIFISHLSTR